MKLIKLTTVLLTTSASLLFVSCASNKMPGKYALYDASSPTGPKSYAEFYVKKMPSSNPIAASLGGTRGTRIMMGEVGQEKTIGGIGAQGCERLRVVLPPGKHHFKCGPGFNDANVDLVTTLNNVVMVETHSSVNPGAQLAIGIVGAIATANCNVKISPPQPCNTNDRNWVPIQK